jgi:tetratricopeptide (TPR) repeat protein
VGRLSEAILAYEKSVELDPQDFFGHAKLGWCYLQSGRNQDALATFLNAAKLNSNDADLHYFLGETHLKLGNREGAELEYEILREIHQPLAEDLQKLLERNARDDRESLTNS